MKKGRCMHTRVHTTVFLLIYGDAQFKRTHAAVRVFDRETDILKGCQIRSDRKPQTEMFFAAPGSFRYTRISGKKVTFSRPGSASGERGLQWRRTPPRWGRRPTHRLLRRGGTGEGSRGW